MAELTLDKEQRLALRAQAHALRPVVLLGTAGLTGPVYAEIDRALNAHGLIKVRIPSDDREERESIYAAVADRLAAARIQAIGKLIVLFRPIPDDTLAEGDQKSNATPARLPAKRTRQDPARPAAKPRPRQHR